MNSAKRIFKRGSKTYYYSSVFFPAHIRRDVETLYAFVRSADDFVDATPQDAQGFAAFRAEYERARAGESTANPIISAFVLLERERRFEHKWTNEFLDAMQADLTKRTYSSLRETESYMYGSAEVIGLYMARILDLPQESYEYAMLLGKAMQYINFIRDVQEDLALGRQYIPTSELKKFGLKSLDPAHTRAHPQQFIACMRAQIELYRSWQAHAELGFAYIPRRYRVAIQTASAMYAYTAERIALDPFIVYERKVKPSIARIVLTACAFAVQRSPKGRIVLHAAQVKR